MFPERKVPVPAQEPGGGLFGGPTKDTASPPPAPAQGEGLFGALAQGAALPTPAPAQGEGLFGASHTQQDALNQPQLSTLLSIHEASLEGWDNQSVKDKADDMVSNRQMFFGKHSTLHANDATTLQVGIALGQGTAVNQGILLFSVINQDRRHKQPMIDQHQPQMVERSQPQIGISWRWPWYWVLLLVHIVSSVAGGPTCQDSLSPRVCAQYKARYTCNGCCLHSTQQSVRTACRATCDFCTPLTTGSSYHTEHLRLARLYQDTDGGFWAHKDNWLDKNTSHCLWFGVNCNATGAVTILTLTQNQLIGTMPVQLAGLAGLNRLYLSNNQLSGTVPVQLTSLTKLSGLDLSNNQLSGTVPVQLTSLTKLSGLDLPSNQLSGTVPVQLRGLTKLSGLQLFNNQLSGTVPAQLTSLTGLNGLDLTINRLSGTVPVQLTSLTGLNGLDLTNNQLSGTVPVQLTSLTGLSGLYLHINRLSGTVPVQLCGLTRLLLDLGYNRLSGTVPVQLTSATRLIWLELTNNRLSGTVPVQLASLAGLSGLALSNNRLSGTVPAQWASLGGLSELYLHSNSLSGTVPLQLTSLTGLSELDLSNNRLSGTVPVQLTSLTGLSGLDLSNNRLSGTVPVQLTTLTGLSELNLSNNRLSGTVPVQLTSLTMLLQLKLNHNSLSGSLPHPPLLLQQLVLHQNQLSGGLLSFANYSQLQVLTLFGNSLQGRLRLPRQADQLQVVAMHRNRLSCPVEYNSTSYNLSHHGLHYQYGALMAPGNRFSSTGKPAWALMSGVQFQWVPGSFWSEWSIEICVAVMGVVAAAIIVNVVLKEEWPSLLCFSTRGLYGQYSWLCMQVLLGLGVLVLGLVPVYITGAGEFECGNSWLRTTLAYLSGSARSEEQAAMLICVAVAAQAFGVLSVRGWVNKLDDEETALGAIEPLSRRRWLVVCLVWPVAVLLLSMPSFLSTLAKSVPGGQNTLRLSQPVLDGFVLATSPLLSFTDTVLLPTTARWLVGKRGCRLVVDMMLIARFVILLVVPLVTAVVLGSDCYGLWVRVWEPCQDSESFNMRYTGPTSLEVEGTTSYWYAAQTTWVTRHVDVCEAQTPATGRCPRFVIERVAELVVGKLVFTVFASPVLTVMLSLPRVVAARRWAMQTLLRRKYTRTLDLDLEVVMVSMLLEEALVLGVVVPVIPLLCGLAVIGRLAVVHMVTSRLGVVFEHGEGARPRWQYLAGSLLIGCGMLLCFFVSNQGRIQGSIIVYVGLPIGLMSGAGCRLAWQLRYRWLRGGAPEGSGIVALLLGEQDAAVVPECDTGSNAHAQAGAYQLWDDSLNQAKT